MIRYSSHETTHGDNRILPGRYWQGVELMQRPASKVEFTHTPRGGGQSESWVQI